MSPATERWLLSRSVCVMVGQLHVWTKFLLPVTKMHLPGSQPLAPAGTVPVPYGGPSNQ